MGEKALTTDRCGRRMASEERRAVVGQPSGLKERGEGMVVGLTTVVAAVTLVVI